MKYSTKFTIIAALILLYVGIIAWNSFQTIIIDGDHYRKKMSVLKVDSVEIAQLRGFIFAEGGEMLAGSLPEYDIFLDFKSTTVKNSNGKMNIPPDTIAHYFGPNGAGSAALHQVAPQKSAEEYGRLVMEAYRKRRPRYKILRRLSYTSYKTLRTLPYFKKSIYVNGLAKEELAHRYRPYGDHRMAASTIGGVYAKRDSMGVAGKGRGGLEEAMDSLLRGQPGLGFRQTIRRRTTEVSVRQPINGANVHTTINVEMQDILDRALYKRIIELHAAEGWAAFLEVKTGKIRAISNFRRINDEECVEDHNHLFEDLVDPGSTFKTVSYMIMLDEGKITPETKVNTGNTEEHHTDWQYHGQHIRDDHPVGEVTADEAIVQSSNIAVAKLTTNAYANDEQAYLDAIERIGFLNDRKIDDDEREEIKQLGYLSQLDFRKEFPKARAARHRQRTGRSWSKVSLAQISYGYETQIPGIYMLQFYNAIANNGKLVRPYLVEYVEKDGDVIWEQEPTVINKSICKETTLKAVRHALEGVVEHGTAAGRPRNHPRGYLPGAKSEKVSIAGKTGTAQRYNTITHNYSGAGHNVSFVGYFPADDPQYCGIVVINSYGSGISRAGGGFMAGPVFRTFAEEVYALHCNRSIKEVKPDTIHSLFPTVKSGPVRETEYVLDKLDLKMDSLSYKMVELDTYKNDTRIPDVKGMGASDALYLLESMGLRVGISGKGAVYSQSLPPGSQFSPGSYITIHLK